MQDYVDGMQYGHAAVRYLPEQESEFFGNEPVRIAVPFEGLQLCLTEPDGGVEDERVAEALPVKGNDDGDYDRQG